METQDSLIRGRRGSSVRLGNWKLIHNFENNDPELFNLKDDIGEMKNRSKSDPEKTKESLGLLVN